MPNFINGNIFFSQNGNTDFSLLKIQRDELSIFHRQSTLQINTKVICQYTYN